MKEGRPPEVYYRLFSDVKADSADFRALQPSRVVVLSGASSSLPDPDASLR